jgi:hypothetical protein
MVRRVGIAAIGVTIHTLRHTCISRMVATGSMTSP